MKHTYAQLVERAAQFGTTWDHLMPGDRAELLEAKITEAKYEDKLSWVYDATTEDELSEIAAYLGHCFVRPSAAMNATLVSRLYAVAEEYFSWRIDDEIQAEIERIERDLREAI